jgi:hypothetical protein
MYTDHCPPDNPYHGCIPFFAGLFGVPFFTVHQICRVIALLSLLRLIAVHHSLAEQGRGSPCFFLPRPHGRRPPSAVPRRWPRRRSAPPPRACPAGAAPPRHHPAQTCCSVWAGRGWRRHARSGQNGAVLRSPASVPRPGNARAFFATAFLGRRPVSNASTRLRHSASGPTPPSAANSTCAHARTASTCPRTCAHAHARPRTPTHAHARPRPRTLTGTRTRSTDGPDGLHADTHYARTHAITRHTQSRDACTRRTHTGHTKSQHGGARHTPADLAAARTDCPYPHASLPSTRNDVTKEKSSFGSPPQKKVFGVLISCCSRAAEDGVRSTSAEASASATPQDAGGP